MAMAGAFKGVMIGTIASLVCFFGFGFPLWLCFIVYALVGAIGMLTAIFFTIWLDDDPRDAIETAQSETAVG